MPVLSSHVPAASHRTVAIEPSGEAGEAADAQQPTLPARGAALAEHLRHFESDVPPVYPPWWRDDGMLDEE